MRPQPRKPVTPPRNRLSPETVFRASQASRPDAAPPARPNLGPRPISPTQRALNEAKAQPPLPPPPPGPPASRVRGKAVHVRDGQTARRTVRRTNRKRRNLPRLLLGWASATLALECVAALLWSPRFDIRQVSVSGNRQIATSDILNLAGALKGRNLVRLPTGKIHQALLTEPTLESVSVERSLPATVHLKVTERQPWASVLLPDGRNVTIDQKLVPFRVTKAPEANLPRLILAPAATDATPLLPGAKLDPPVPVALGKPLTTPGLSDVSRCLEWARMEPDFRVESVEIDPTGKLCLNRSGGVQVRLGSQTDLEKKLKSLGLLLVRRPDLRRETRVAYVNLYAFDAPALGPPPKADPDAPTSGNAGGAENINHSEASSARRPRSRRTVRSTPRNAG